MQPEANTPEKQNLHPRNLHRERYNFRQLVKSNAALKQFVSLNQYGDESIDFTNPAAVKELNRALLKHFYGIAYWDIPEGYLCPPIPGRADYIHYLADLLTESNNGSIPTGPSVKILDIGTGANAVYPLIGSSIYNWKFVGAEVDLVALASAKNIVALNKPLKNKIEIRRQASKSSIFGGIINTGEVFDATMCNPPFHSSALEAKEATATKWRKLGVSPNKASQNFGGQKTELWYPGGEAAFIVRMINESAVIPENCKWFTTLVSKKETLPVVQKALNSVRATDVRVINMSQGQKMSRILAWRF